MWVLIAFLNVHHAGGPLVVDFRSEAACVAAKAAIEAKHYPFAMERGDSWVICTPKFIKDIPNG